MQYRYWRSIDRSACRKCAAPLWSGYDNDMLACRAVVDAATFVTHEGECWAVLEGRETWLYQVEPARRIWVRERWHRRAQRAGEPALVVVEHVCGSPVPGEYRFRPPRKKQTPTRLPADIPF